MPDNEVNLKIKVTAEGADKLTQIDGSMGKLEKTTAITTTGTQRVSDATQLYNTSLIKAMPQLQAINPLMSSLGLSALITTGAIGLLGLGMLKIGQSVIATNGSLTDLGITMGKYTQGPVKDYAADSSTIVDLSNKLNLTVKGAASSFGTLIEATRDQGTALKLLDAANKASIATGKSMATVSKDIAQAYSQGAIIGGKMIPPGMGAAMGEAQVMETQTSTFNRFMSGFKRYFGRLFDPSGPDFILSQMGGRTRQLNPADLNKTIGPQTTTPATTPTTAPTSIVGPTSMTIPVNIDGQKVAGIILDIINGQVRVRGAS